MNCYVGGMPRTITAIVRTEWRLLVCVSFVDLTCVKNFLLMLKIFSAVLTKP